MNDLSIAGRHLAKDRSFSLLAVLVLTLGIGGVATQFSVINGLLLRPAAFADPDRLVNVSLVDTSRQQPVGGATTADFLDWSATQKSFTELACYGARLSINVTYQDVPRRYAGVYVTHNFFRALGIAPLLGRDFTAADDQPGAAKVILISHDVWQGDFGGSRDVVGQAVTVNGRPGTIVGVMPPGFNFPFSEKLWTPLFAEFPPLARDHPQAFGGAVVGRLKAEASARQAAAELSAFARRIATEYPRTHGNFTAVQVTPFAESFVGPQLRRIVFLMFAAVLVVLLIACVNVMNMQLARAARRMRDLAVCSALGASRARLLRQMLCESLLLACAGAVGGTFFAWWATSALHAQSRRLPTPPPSWVNFELDWRVLAVTCGVTLTAALVSGLAPAWLASRANPLELMREGGRGGSGRRINLLIRGLVVAQIGLTAALLVLSSFTIRSIVNQQRIDWGYDTSRVLLGRMTLFQADYPTPDAIGRFCARTLATLRADPHFSAVALTTRFRMATSQNGRYEVEGASAADPNARPTAAIEPISDGYFATLGRPLVAGRDFSLDDTLDRPPVAIVNTAFARRHFGHDSPLGRRVRLGGGNNPGPWLVIVGVAPDTRMQGPYDGDSDGAGIFVPLVQAPQRWITLVVRGRGGAPETWAEPLRRAMAPLDRNLPIYMVDTAERLINGALAQNRLLTSLFSIFGAVAMLLAAVGLYGVMSFAVSQRTNEYGIRMALGADPRGIRRMILRQAATQLALGLALGVALSVVLLLLGRAALQGFLYRVSRADPVVWGAAILLVSAATLLACLAPARRATRVNPVEALRAE